MSDGERVPNSVRFSASVGKIGLNELVEKKEMSKNQLRGGEKKKIRTIRLWRPAGHRKKKGEKNTKNQHYSQYEP